MSRNSNRVWPYSSSRSSKVIDLVVNGKPVCDVGSGEGAMPPGRGVLPCPPHKNFDFLYRNNAFWCTFDIGIYPVYARIKGVHCTCKKIQKLKLVGHCPPCVKVGVKVGVACAPPAPSSRAPKIWTFWGHPFQKLYPRYHVCHTSRRLV